MFQGSVIVFYDWKIKMGVDLGIIMIWEMFGGGCNFFGLNVVNLFDVEYFDVYWIVFYGFYFDYGIGWVSVDVNVWGEVYVNVQGSQFVIEYCVLGMCSVWVIDSIQCYIFWKFGGWGGNLCDDIVFLIDSDG